MQAEVAGSTGIGALVRQYVRERWTARKEADAPAPSRPTRPSGDTVELSAAAMARFEVWKAKHSAPVAEVTEPIPVTDPTPDVTSSLSILV